MNRHGRVIDKTYLNIDNAEERGFIHRDYIAHCLRWTYVVKCLMKKGLYKYANILDIGCGKKTPLIKLMYSSKMFPKTYLGVDVGTIDVPHLGKYQSQAAFLPKTDVLDIRKDGTDPFNVVTCFEVLEHVEPEHMLELIRQARSLTTDDAEFFFSTPCWNRTACAGNHVNEVTYDALRYIFDREGFRFQGVYGTFASQSEIVPDFDEEEKSLFEDLRDYYDSNMLACIFAPLHPAKSRNCLWHLRKDGKNVDVYEKPSMDLPWSSSDKKR